tara:strand:+ start:124 stop:435 length:312 start_codon:yes stop_codon:yes gene_type:complete
MKRVKEFFYKASKSFCVFMKKEGLVMLGVAGMTLWVMLTVYAVTAHHEKKRYDVECYSGINKIYEADRVKVTWTGFNNIEVFDEYREKKIYGDCVLILNEERR